MPIAPTYPGVYIEEIPSGVRTIVGVATSITAFIGRATRGPTSEPIRIQNFGDFERKFGKLDVACTLGYAVQHFFLNGGTDAIIVRVAHAADAVKATIDAGGLTLEASGEGAWGNNLRVRIDYDTRDLNDPTLFNISIHDAGLKSTEIFRNVSIDPDSPRYVATVLEQDAVFVRVLGAVPAQRPGANNPPATPTEPLFADNQPYYYPSKNDGVDGTAINDADILGSEQDKKGLFALEKTDLFNILCIPPLTRKDNLADDTYSKAAAYCVSRRAFLIVDPKYTDTTVESGETLAGAILNAVTVNNGKNAAVFFPCFKAPDPLKENRLQDFAPCGAVAGVMSRTDLQRGVWKSPAGTEASVTGATKLSFTMTDLENGRLNPLGVNCLRTFPGYGTVIWGARTVVGSDRLANEWKYLAIRRFTLFIEESLFRGTKWAVFEPNDEPLWAQIRLNIGSFMHGLFRKQAFQGRSPAEAYFVNCGKETTSQSDINQGVVNIHVGFAPLRPAEFVIIQIQQMAGKLDT